MYLSPRTPLMLAVAYGHIDAVSLLLEKEANVDAVDIMGCTALHRGVRTSESQSSHLVMSTLPLYFPSEFLVKSLFPRITNEPQSA